MDRVDDRFSQPSFSIPKFSLLVCNERHRSRALD